MVVKEKCVFGCVGCWIYMVLLVLISFILF